MKHLAFLFLGFTLLFASCSTADAELVADDFHKNMVEVELVVQEVELMVVMHIKHRERVLIL